MKQNKLLNIFLITLPILDLLTSLNSRILGNFISIGTIVKGLAILLSYIYVFFYSSSKFKKKSIIFYISLIVYILIYFLLKMDLIQSGILNYEINYIMKLIYFPVMLFSLLNVYDDYDFNKENLNKIMLINLICYIVLIIVPTILDINFKSYSNSNYFGSVGWYYAANEVSTILLLLFPYIYTILKKHLLVSFFLFGSSLYTISLIGTKVTLFGIIIITFLVFLVTIIKEKNLFSKYVFITLFMFIITTIFMLNNYSAINMKNSLNQEEIAEMEKLKNEIEEKYKDSSNRQLEKIMKIAQLLLSSRDVYALNTYHIYNENFRADYFLFGMGFSKSERINDFYIEKLAEIDFIDVFFHLGIIGLIIMLFPLIYVFVYFLKKFKKININIFFYTMIILLTLGISSTAGHVYLAPAVTIYIVIYYLYLFNELKAFEKKKINEKKIIILGLHMGHGGIENTIANTASMLSENYEVEIVSLYKKVEEIPFKINKKVKVKYLLNISSNREEFMNALKNHQYNDMIKEGLKSVYILLNKNVLMKKAIINSDAKIIISTRYSFSKILNKFGRHDSIKIHQEHTYTINNKYIKKLNHLANIDYIMPISKALLKAYQTKINIKIKYIPLALNYFPDKNELSTLNTKNLIAIGRLEKEKAMVELVYIMEELVKEDKEIKLNIFGDGSENIIIQKSILEKNLSHNVTLWGFKSPEEMKNIIRESSLLLMTSYEESFGLVLIEAMSYGIPCIAYTSAEGAKELITQKNGYLIKERNREKYINAIKTYLNLSPKDKNVIGNNARKTSETYKYEKIQKEWINFIKQILTNIKNI